MDSGSKPLELIWLRDSVDVDDQADQPSASPECQPTLTECSVWLNEAASKTSILSLKQTDEN